MHIQKLNLSTVAKLAKRETSLTMCIVVTLIHSAATVHECFLVLQAIKYFRRQMFSILDNLLEVRAWATFLMEMEDDSAVLYTGEDHLK